MGGCASKPKGLKADIDAAPSPAPAKEESQTVSESKIDGETKEIVGEVKKIEEGKEANVDGEEKVVKVEEDFEVDENGNKRRSLSHLFKENEGNKPTDNDTVTLEPRSENATEESNTNVPEIENATKEVVVVPDIDKPIEVAPPVETEKVDNSTEKKTKEEGEGVVANNVEVTEKVPDVDVRHEEHILPVSSTEKVVDGEVVTEAK